MKARFGILLSTFLLTLVAVTRGQTFTGSYFDLDGDSLYFQESGRGFPLVLVSGGSGMDMFQWHRVAPILATEYRVILVDPRGVGRSSTPKSRYSDAVDLESLFEHLGLARLVIIGLSSAGGLVLEYALRYPDRLAGVVACGPFVPGFQFSDEMRARLNVFSKAAEEGRKPFLDSMFDDAYFFPAPLDRSLRTEARANMGRNYDKSVGIDPNLAIPLDPPLLVRLSDVKPRVRLVVGALDHPEVLRRNRIFVAEIPNADERVVASSGHNVPLENPEGFLEAIRPFLERVATRR